MLPTGFVGTALQLVSGVSGPVLDVFFVRSKMGRHAVVATKALTQSLTHLAKIIYFGGVVVAPKASELILPITMAIENNLTVDQLAHTITIYPSLSGSIAEAARQLMLHERQ